MQSKQFVAPGRVNLIGEHTDYTGGLVLPIAIPFTTTVSISPHSNGYRFESAAFQSIRDISSAEGSKQADDWSDYAVGVLAQLQSHGISVPFFHMYVAGDVPLGSGLSSSASLEVASALAMLSLAGTKWKAAEIAKLCQRAENEYVGSPCGIMDQLAVTVARQDHALFLNTGDLSYEHLPLHVGGLSDCKIVVVNSMVKHSIAGGEYGARRKQVEEGQAVLLKAYPHLHYLAEASLQQLAACEHSMSPESVRRCRHILSENDRVREARGAILSGNAAEMGKVMSASHVSQRDLFECSCAEIDFLVRTALEVEGCYGARLTGGGFGGCTVNLMHKKYVDAFQESVAAAYGKQYSLQPEVYVCEAVSGAAQRAGTEVVEA